MSTEENSSSQNTPSKKITIIIAAVFIAVMLFLGFVILPKVTHGLRAPIEALQRTCESVGGTYHGSFALGECVDKDGFVISIQDKELITEDK